MKKRGFAFILSALLALGSVLGYFPAGLLDVRAEEAEVTSGECGVLGNNVIWEYDVISKTLTISGEGAMLGYSDWGSQPWYSLQDTIEKIIVEDGITDIGVAAFASTRAREIILPDTLKTIGNGAFRANGYLTGVVLPEQLEEIGEHAFADDICIESIIVPGGVKEIKKEAFEGCTGLRFVDLREGVASIGSKAFENAGLGGSYDVLVTRRLSIYLPSTLEAIAYDAFYQDRDVFNTIYGKSEAAREYAEAERIIYVDATKQYDITLAQILSDEQFYYTGEKVEPNPPIYYSMTEGDADFVKLIKGKDYEVSYINSDKPGVATATIRGLGVYNGESDWNYFIVIPLSEAAITLGENTMVYDGTEKRPSVKVSYLEQELKEGTDYSLNYTDNTNVGTASVTIETMGNSYGSQTVNFEIREQNLRDSVVALTQNMYIFDETEKKPDVTVKYEGRTLVRDEDYTVEYTNNKEAGKASVTVTGVVAKGYVGSQTVNFEIREQNLQDSTITLSQNSYIYDKTEKKPMVTVRYGGKTLTEGTDYTVSYANAKEAGIATVTVTGVVAKGYTGIKTVNYSIIKQNLQNAQVTLSQTEYTYDGTEKKPTVTVKLGDKTLKENTDYTLTYGDTISAGETPITVTGMDLYEGKKTISYAINPYSIENAQVQLKETIYSYDGSPKKPSVSVKLGDKVLVEKQDYRLTYKNNVDDGTAYAVVTGIGNYTDVIEMSFVILPYNAGMDAVYEEGALIDGKGVYGILDDEANEVEFCCPATKNLSAVQIPATVECDGQVYTVTSIGQKAFYKNTKISSLIVGNNVRSIENYAFYGCKNLKTVKFGKNIDIIGDSAFRKCTKLTGVTLPKSIDQLGKNCFYGCSKLKTITISATSVIDIKSNAIKGISKKAVIKVPKKLVKKYQKKLTAKTGFKKTMKIKKK